MALVRVLAAHCGICGSESYGWRVNIDDEGEIIWDAFYPHLPQKVLPYPVVVPVEAVAPVDDVYKCEHCGAQVLVATEPA